MNLRFTSNIGARHIREFADITVYYIDRIPTSSVFAPTTDIGYAKYFLRNIAGTYVSLAAVEQTYTTTHEEATLLHSLQEQYTPEVLI